MTCTVTTYLGRTSWSGKLKSKEIRKRLNNKRRMNSIWRWWRTLDMASWHLSRMSGRKLAERAMSLTEASLMTSCRSNHSMTWSYQQRLPFSTLKRSEISLMKMLSLLYWTINSRIIVYLKEVEKLLSPKINLKALISVIHSDTTKLENSNHFLNFRKLIVHTSMSYMLTRMN